MVPQRWEKGRLVDFLMWSPFFQICRTTRAKSMWFWGDCIGLVSSVATSSICNSRNLSASVWFPKNDKPYHIISKLSISQLNQLMREHILAHPVQLLWNVEPGDIFKTALVTFVTNFCSWAIGSSWHKPGKTISLRPIRQRGDLYWRISQQTCRDKWKLQGQKPQMGHNVHIKWSNLGPAMAMGQWGHGGTLVVNVKVTRRLMESFRKGTCACGTGDSEWGTSGSNELSILIYIYISP